MGNSRAHLSARSTAFDLGLLNFDPSVLCQLLKVTLMSLLGRRVWGDDHPHMAPGCHAGLGRAPAIGFQLVTGACGFSFCSVNLTVT